MTTRLDENNIVEYLHGFNKNHIRQGKHANSRAKERKFSFEYIANLLTMEYPVAIEQQEVKKFALTYDFNDKYNIFIVISIKDKFINLVTQHKIDKTIKDFVNNE